MTRDSSHLTGFPLLLELCAEASVPFSPPLPASRSPRLAEPFLLFDVSFFVSPTSFNAPRRIPLSSAATLSYASKLSFWRFLGFGLETVFRFFVAGVVETEAIH